MAKTTKTDRTIIDHYRSIFISDEKRFSYSPSIQKLRSDAFEHFADLGFPTTKMEDWKDTDVSLMAKTPFYFLNGEKIELPSDFLNDYLPADSHVITIVNGKITPDFSDYSELSDSVTIKNIDEALQDSSDLIESHFCNHSISGNNPFVALNTAFLKDGIFLHVKKDQVIKKPIHLLFIASNEKPNIIINLRNMFLLDDGCEATIIEHYIGDQKSSYFANGVTEIVIRENAVIDHIKLQEEASFSDHISTTNIIQKTDSQLSSNHITVGGRLTRNDVQVSLDGAGSNCLLNGLTLSKYRQHVDNHTIIDHVTPNCTSNELYKGIYKDQARGVFNGRIIVREDAQKTDANQTNKNLLLSKSALINSNPQLEIYADDVKCSHGSTTGELEEDALYYLRSRGINLEEAKALLINGFANDIIDQIKVESIKKRVNMLLSEWLSENGS